MLIGLQTRRYCEQILVRTDPCKNKDMLRTHLSLCIIKSTKVDLENKETDQFLERWFPPCGLFSFSSFLAEFPSGAWRLAKPANFALASKTHTRGSPRQGTLRYSSGHQWPM